MKPMASLRRLHGVRSVFCEAARRLAQAGAALALAAGTPARAHECPLAGEKPMLVVEMFFGRAMPHGKSVSDAAWSAFAGRVIAKEFPDGFTVEDANGNWTDPLSHRLVRERSKVLVVAAPRDGLATKLEAISAAYRSEFHQSSVGVVTSEACGKF